MDYREQMTIDTWAGRVEITYEPAHDEPATDADQRAMLLADVDDNGQIIRIPDGVKMVNVPGAYRAVVRGGRHDGTAGRGGRRESALAALYRECAGSQASADLAE